MPEPTQSAFISYCRDDQEFALRLAQDLKAAGASVWLDQLDILSGDPWDTAVQDAIIAAPCVLTVLSPASARSRNVLNEISFSLEQDKVIIPVLYRDCIVPLQLQRNNRIDFRADYAAGLTQLLKRLQVANPNKAVLDRAAEGDAQRQLAWQAREAEARRLEELKQQEQAEAQRQRELEQQAAQAAERLAAQENARRQAAQQPAAPAPTPIVPAWQPPNTPTGNPDKSIPLWLKSGWIAFGGLAAILIVYFIFHKSPPPAGTASQSTPAVTPQLPPATYTATTPAPAQPSPVLPALTAPPTPTPSHPKPVPASPPPSSADPAAEGNSLFASNNYKEALAPLSEACRAGDANACGTVGDIYEFHNGGTPDYGKALIFYSKACDGKYPIGCIDLGSLYAHGQGTAANPALARKYLQMGCDLGNKLGCDELKDIK